MNIHELWKRNKQKNSKNEFNLEEKRKEIFNKMINAGLDRKDAYQIVYGLDEEEAMVLATRDLISDGVSPEMAAKIVFKNEESSAKKR